MPASNKKVVPACQPALDAMKYEIAAELGLSVAQSAAGADSEFAAELGTTVGGVRPREAYWGHLTAREAGSVGGEITRRLIEQAEMTQHFAD